MNTFFFSFLVSNLSPPLLWYVHFDSERSAFRVLYFSKRERKSEKLSYPSRLVAAWSQKDLFLFKSLLHCTLYYAVHCLGRLSARSLHVVCGKGNNFNARCTKRCGERSFFLFSRDRHIWNYGITSFCHENYCGKAIASLVSKFQTQEGEIRKACLALIASTTELFAAFLTFLTFLLSQSTFCCCNFWGFEDPSLWPYYHGCSFAFCSDNQWKKLEHFHILFTIFITSHILITGIHWIFLCGHGCSWLSVQTLQVHLASLFVFEFSCDSATLFEFENPLADPNSTQVKAPLLLSF